MMFAKERKRFFDTNKVEEHWSTLHSGVCVALCSLYQWFSTARCSSYSVFIQCCSLSRDGRIYPIPSAIAHTPSLHLSRLRTSSFKSISVSSSTCFFQVFFGHPRFLLPLTSRSRATLKTLPSFLLSTCPYHLTPFAVANWSIVSFNPNMSICSSVVFLSTTF